jgi:hypothetical protein
MHLRKRFEITTIDDAALEELKHAKSKHKKMSGCPNYEIISNPSYASAF